MNIINKPEQCTCGASVYLRGHVPRIDLSVALIDNDTLGRIRLNENNSIYK